MFCIPDATFSLSEEELELVVTYVYWSKICHIFKIKL